MGATSAASAGHSVAVPSARRSGAAQGRFAAELRMMVMKMSVTQKMMIPIDVCRQPYNFTEVSEGHMSKSQ